jgi:hypothetical protein
LEKKMMTCIYCAERELLGRHHIACPARPTPAEQGAGQLDSSRVDVAELAIWRRGHDDAATGHINAGEAHPTYQLGWTMRVTRENPPQLRPAMFLSLQALLTRLRGKDLRTDTFGIQLANSLFCLDGDAAEASVVVRYWPAFPRLREPSTDERARADAEHVLRTSADEAARREAHIVLHGESDDEIRLRVHGMLRTAEAGGRLIWRGAHEVDPPEVDWLLERNGLQPTGSSRRDPELSEFAARIEIMNFGAVLAVA